MVGSAISRGLEEVFKEGGGVEKELVLKNLIVLQNTALNYVL